MLRVLVTCLIAVLPAVALAQSSCAIASEVERAIQAQYPDFRRAVFEDLSLDDQKLWRGKWGHTCPTVVAFANPRRLALMLVARSAKKFSLVSYSKPSRNSTPQLSAVVEGSYASPPVIRPLNASIVRMINRKTKPHACPPYRKENAVVLEFIESAISVYSVEKAGCGTVLIE